MIAVSTKKIKFGKSEKSENFTILQFSKERMEIQTMVWKWMHIGMGQFTRVSYGAMDGKGYIGHWR